MVCDRLTVHIAEHGITYDSSSIGSFRVDQDGCRAFGELAAVKRKSTFTEHYGLQPQHPRMEQHFMLPGEQAIKVNIITKPPSVRLNLIRTTAENYYSVHAFMDRQINLFTQTLQVL